MTMVETIDIQKVCRACLVDTGPFTDLLSIATPETILYSEMLMDCTFLNVSDSDRLPKQMCNMCIEILPKLYNFKQMAIKSDFILKQHIDQLSEKAVIKIEYSNKNNGINETSLFSDDLSDGSLSSREDTVEMQIKREITPVKKKVHKKEPAKIKSSKIMQCPKCPKVFKKHENFEAHLRSHFGKKPDMKCSICEKVFTTLRNFNRHMIRHNPVRKFQCPTCGKSFAYPHVLKTHEMIHADIKKHVCHICHARFVQLSNLKTHLASHRQERNYQCTQCDKKFSQPNNLRMHLIRHSGVKNVACSLCDSKFYIKADLKRHMSSHSSEKPYTCEHCGKTFKSPRYKIEHIRSHTGERPYPCDLCPKRFMSTKVMRNHRMTHTGEKPYKCQMCAQGFIQKYSLVKHMKSHSKNDETPHGIRNCNGPSIKMGCVWSRP